MTYYLVDTENIGNQWTHFIKELTSGDHLIMFHTDANSLQSITLEQISLVTSLGQIKLYSVKCGRGDNALDFQLSSYLGFLLATANQKADRFIIISKDKGYDPLITFWKSKGYSLYRKEPDVYGSVKPSTTHHSTSKSSHPSAEKPTTHHTHKSNVKYTPLDTVRMAYIDLLRQAGITNGAERDKITNVMVHTINLPHQGQALQIQNQMRQNFGSKRGMVLYNKTKPVFDHVIQNGPYPPKRRRKPPHEIHHL